MSGALRPIAEAFEAAAAADAAAEAGLRQRAEDVAFLQDCLRRNGPERFRQVGRAFGFAEDDLDQVLTEAQAAAAAAEEKALGGKRGRKKPKADAPVPGPAGEDGASPFLPPRNPIKPLPADCPIIPLGHRRGTFWFMNKRREVIGIGPDGTLGSFNAEGIRSLFAGHIEYLWVTWPKYKAEGGPPTGWKPDACGESLREACEAKGLFDPLAQLRGTGGWADGEGGLVLHAGDRVLMGGEWREPGLIGGMIYPAGPAAPKPAEAGDPGSGPGGAGRAEVAGLLKLLDTWDFRSADDDGIRLGDVAEGLPYKLASLLLLGWNMAAIAGGALAYRPVIWVTGDAGSGKTTLLNLVQGVQGANLVASSNPTAAGIWQTIGASTRAVAVDEGEASPHDGRMRAIVELARQAATGGVILRGSNDHTATRFECRSAFIFGSIIVPPMMPQDLSRLAVIELAAMPGGRALVLDPVMMAATGAALRRRLVDGWARWPETFARYRAALADTGHNARGCDQWGTLLAMADLALWDAPADSDTVLMLAGELARSRTDTAQYVVSNAEAMLTHLTSEPLDVFRGGTRMTIGALVAIASEYEPESDGATMIGCRNALLAWGVYVEGFKAAARVTLPNGHAGLAKLLRETAWRGEAGASGGWAQALRRLPGCRRENSRRLGGRGWSVPAWVFLMREEA